MPDGLIEIRLDETEADILLALSKRLDSIVGEADTAGDSVLRRLRPDAYPDDRLAEEEFRDSVGRSIDQDRHETAGLVADALDRGRLPDGSVRAQVDADGADAFVKSINQIRLTVGTLLGIENDDNTFESLDRDDPMYPQASVYMWLGYVLECLIQTTAESHSFD